MMFERLSGETIEAYDEKLVIKKPYVLVREHGIDVFPKSYRIGDSSKQIPVSREGRRPGVITRSI